MKYFLIIFFLLFTTPSYAWNTILLGGGVESEACTTPADGDELNEGFLGTGYEESGWSETVEPGATLDEDHTLSGSPLTGSCSEGLYVDIPANSDVTYASRSLSLSPTIDVYFELYPISASSGTSITILELTGGDNVKLGWTGTEFSLTARGSTNSTAVTFSANAWHEVHLHIDSTAANSYIEVDEGTDYGYTSNGDFTTIHFGAYDSVGSTEELEYEVGRLWIDTP